jgi:hypothetical protein
MKTLGFLAVALFASSIQAADSAAVARTTKTWRAQHEHEILQEFSELLALPNVASARRLNAMHRRFASCWRSAA